MELTRRNFLALAGLTAAGCRTAVPRAARRRGANERLNIGVIGVGGAGQANWSAAYAEGENIAAMCDVDEAALLMGREKVATACPGVRLYKDFRVMFDAEKGLDAVFVSTPDHGHGLQAAWALGHGCHVYVEPPLARTLREARLLREAARARGLVAEVADPSGAAPEFQRALEVLAAGVLGEVLEVHVWTHRPLWPQGMRRPEGSDPVPPTLDWDLWLGGAAMRPFKSRAYHRYNWRGWHEFGTGALGDAGYGLMRLPFRALGLAAPVTVEAESCSERTGESYPRSSKLRFEFAPAGKRRPPVKLWWYDGLLTPPAELMPQAVSAAGLVPSSGCLLIGERGVWLVSDDSGTRHALALSGEARVTALEKHEACAAVPERLPGAPGRQRAFLDAVRSGVRGESDVARVAPLTECVLTGCVAQRVAGALAWDSRACRFASRGEAELLVAPRFRDGWAWPS